MCPAYIAGLIGSGYRKSIEPMATCSVAIPYDRLYHFIGAGLWGGGQRPVGGDLVKLGR